MEAFKAALLEAIEGKRPAVATEIAQEYDKWRQEMLNAGSSAEEKASLGQHDFAVKQLAKLA